MASGTRRGGVAAGNSLPRAGLALSAPAGEAGGGVLGGAIEAINVGKLKPSPLPRRAKPAAGEGWGGGDNADFPRSGIKTMRTTRDLKLQNFARELRKSMTDAERRLWRYLRSEQLNGIRFRRQYVIGNYITDFAAPEIRLIVELDGGQHAIQQAYDQQRSAFLQSQGYRVLRFWNHDVLQQTESVLAEIRQYCQHFS